MPLLGGYLVDAIGVRTGIFIFSVLVCSGQAIFAFGISIKSYWLGLVGRFVFGMGGESLNVAQSAIVSSWFANKELALALGLNVSISRLGSVFNDLVEPAFYDATGNVVFGLWFGLLICFISLGCGLALNLMDKRRDSKLGIKGKKTLDPSEKVKFSDIKTFKFNYWLICVNCVVVYACVMCFNNVASNFYYKRFGYSKTTASAIISITYAISAVFCPIFGFMVDKIGRRATLILLSSGIMVIVHLAYMAMPDCDGCVYPPFPLVLLGIGYSIYASVMWASIPYIVEPRTVGTAFGVVTSIQNAGLAAIPPAIGGIVSATSYQHGYFWASFFFVVMGLIGLATAIMLFIDDGKKGRVLESKNPNKESVMDNTADKLGSEF